MPCALCLKQKELRKSHIIPDFLYKFIYDDKHRYFVLTTADDEPIKRQWTGINERLLCSECESLIGTYEDYAAKVFKGGVPMTRRKLSDRLVFGGIDYKRFKLFQLSLIWRAGVCRHESMSNVTLGPHAEKMRTMILNGIPGRPHQYGSFLFFSPAVQGVMKSMIYLYEPVRVLGFRAFRAVLGGLLWAFLVASHTESFPYQQAFLSESGELPVFNSGRLGEQFVRGFADGLKKKGKLAELERSTRARDLIQRRI
jgi:hypothetical protein